MDTIAIKRTHVYYCQVCAKEFKDPELVWYAPIDNNIVCEDCSQIHKDRQMRVYVKED